MQTNEAAELRKKWGDKPCNHEQLEPEYYLGAHTGDYSCKKCGETRWGNEWNKPAPAADNASQE